MNSCNDCGSTIYVLNFLDTGNGKYDTYCIECVLKTINDLFGEDTEEIISHFFKINNLENNVESEKASLRWRIKHILTGDRMSLDQVKEFVYGVSYKAPSSDGNEEKNEEK